MENLRTYAERLETALKKQEPFATYNKDILHAAAIVGAGIRHARDEIRILSNKLSPALYGNDDLLASVRNFLEGPSAKLRILVEKDIAEDHPIRPLMGDFPENLKISRVPEEMVEKYEFNFMVVDDFGYRFEGDREKYAATASFHEEEHREMIDGLISFFDNLEKLSPEI